ITMPQDLLTRCDPIRRQLLGDATTFLGYYLFEPGSRSAMPRHPVSDALPTPGEAAIEALVQEAMHAWTVPGAAVAIVRGDEVVYLQGSGIKEVGNNQVVTPYTLFAIGSTTKAFTTTAMAMLVEEGKMAWDDPVRKHVEFFRLSDPLADQNVTLRDIVCHRTGLDRHDALWYGSPWGREEIIRRIGRVKLNASFRS